MGVLLFMPKAPQPLPSEIDAHIYAVRNQRVMLDRDLAVLFGVTTKALKQAVKRNNARFPPDFAFPLARAEIANLRSQSVTSSSDDIELEKLNISFDFPKSDEKSHGGRRYLPIAFTQEGVAMLSSVLRSPRAIAVNIEIMRAFVRMRRLTLSVKELAAKVEHLEKKYDGQFGLVFDAIKELMAQSAPPAPEDEGVIGYLGRPKKGRST
jgi:hypothetical protein